MKPEEARQVIGMIKAAVRGYPIQEEEVAIWEESLAPLDAELATKAVLTGRLHWQVFPSWAEFWASYKVQQKLSSPDTYFTAPERPTGPQVPFWVKRAIAARFLYRRFGKSQDMRPFPEQHDGFRDLRSYHGGGDKSGYKIPTTKELMPEGEWNDEANRVSDADVWATFRSSAVAPGNVDEVIDILSKTQ